MAAAEEHGLEPQLDGSVASSDGGSSDDSGSESDHSSSPATAAGGAGMQLFSGSARKRARVSEADEGNAAEKPAAAASSGSSGSSSSSDSSSDSDSSDSDSSDDDEEGDKPKDSEEGKKKKKALTEEKKAKIRAMKLAAKERRAKRAAEIDPFSAQAALLKTSGQQAIQLWDFILKHTSVEFSDMEKKNLRLTAKNISIVNKNGYFANQKQSKKQNQHSAAGSGRTMSQKLHGDDGVCWPGALRSLMHKWKALTKEVQVITAREKKVKGARKRFRGGEGEEPAEQPSASQVGLKTTGTPGSPFTLIVSTAARRCVAIRGGMKPLKWQVAKLFAKHMDASEQADLLAAQAWHAAVGTPSRVGRLVDEGALSLSKLELIVLDAHPNPKGYDILSLRETQQEVADFLAKHVLPLTASGTVKIAFV